MSSIRVALDVDASGDGSSGGVSYIVRGLVRALAELDSPSEHYRLIVGPDNRDAFAVLAGARMDVVVSPWSIRRRWKTVRRLLGRIDPAGRLVAAVRPVLMPRRRLAAAVQHPGAARFLDSLGCQVIHFPTQRFHACTTPAVYNPHDLQHCHYPEFFSPQEVAQREAIYRAGCSQARRVAVSSEWVRRDLIRQYGLDPAKVAVIPWGTDARRTEPSPTELEAARRLAATLGTGGAYALYPAVTWEHKNHLALLDALARLRDLHGERVGLVCPGHVTPYYHRCIRPRIKALGLGRQVCFPGVLPRAALDALYRGCALVVVPTLFEASSALLRDAWHWEAPVACANVTSLPDQAGGAALLFDPRNHSAIAECMRVLLKDRDTAERLRRAGGARAGLFSWRRTALAYRALYRQVGGLSLDPDEARHLAEAWPGPVRGASLAT